MECDGTGLKTDRLVLRRWTPADLDAFAALNADPAVMEFLPEILTREQSDAMADRIERHFQEHGFGLWAVEVVGGPAFIGYVGLLRVGFDAPFAPAVEIGWRLASEQWGCGYATEAATAVLRYGFECLDLAEIVSFTVPDNRRSRAVMERLGMTRDAADDFDHPNLEVGHRLRRHVLYRIARPRAVSAASTMNVKETHR